MLKNIFNRPSNFHRYNNMMLNTVLICFYFGSTTRCQRVEWSYSKRNWTNDRFE